jgi:transposase
MRNIREVLRLHHERGCSQRQIQASTGLSKGAVSDYLRRARHAGMTWELARELSDAEVESRLFKVVGRMEPPGRVPVDFEWVHREMRRTGVTLQLLCVEYQETAVASGDDRLPYQYSQFCDLYASWKMKLALSMRQTHRAGERAFLDYSGKKPIIIERETGELRDVELFVMVLGASNYTFAEASYTQGSADFIASTIRGFEYFGAVPEILVPDQLRSAVSGPDRYDPEINPAYLEMAQHYEVAVIPARARKPRDKAKVEAGVLIAQRWILARLRSRTFFGLDELNRAIAELLEDLNTRPFQKLEGCRRSMFDSIDRPAMRPLPALRFERGDWKRAKVNVDYHVAFDHRYYSVPCALIGAAVEVRATRNAVELFHGGERVGSHARSHGPKGTFVTCREHMPKSHREYGKWPPARMRAWGHSLGPSVGKVVDAILGRYRNPEFGYRAVQALTRDAERVGKQRFDAACARALVIAGPAGPTRRSVVAILKRGLESQPLPEHDDEPIRFVRHEHIRGGDYFDQEKPKND